MDTHCITLSNRNRCDPCVAAWLPAFDICMRLVAMRLVAMVASAVRQPPVLAPSPTELPFRPVGRESSQARGSLVTTHAMNLDMSQGAMVNSGKNSKIQSVNVVSPSRCLSHLRFPLPLPLRSPVRCAALPLPCAALPFPRPSSWPLRAMLCPFTIARSFLLPPPTTP